MKRILFLAACLAAMATAQAQIVPMYSEVYKEKTDTLEYKSWVSAEGNTRQETPDGKVTIMRLDSMMMYKLDPANKTASVLPLSQNLASPEMKGRERKLQLIRENVGVEGYTTNHYKVWDARPENDASVNEREEWIHAPFNTWIRSFWDPLLGASVRRNIKTDSQPASLFEIPRDYKRTNMLGDLQNRMDGMKNAVDMLKQGATGIEQQQKEGEANLNDANKSDQQKMLEFLEQMGKAGKK